MRNRGEGSNTAIVAIVVLVLVGMFAFFVMAGGRRGSSETRDIKVNVEKPASALKDALPPAPKEPAAPSQ